MPPTMILTWSTPPGPAGGAEDDVPPHAVTATASTAPVPRIAAVFADMTSPSGASDGRFVVGELRRAPGQQAALEAADDRLGDQREHRHDHHRGEHAVDVERALCLLYQ